MSNYSLLLDVAKVHQAEVAREVEKARNATAVKRIRKPTKSAKRLRISTIFN